MPQRDEDVFGLSSGDVDEVYQLIGSKESTYIEGLIRAKGRGLVLITPGGGIAARSGSTISSATCTIVNRSGSTISTGTATYTVYNMSTTAVAGTEYIVAIQTNIGLVAVWEDC